MTIKNLFLYSFLQWMFFTALKFVFFQYEILANPGWQNILFWLLAAAIATAFARRYGVINFLEAIFLVIVWVLGDLLLDLMFLSIYLGLGMFAKMEYWVSFFIFGLAVLFFHKKRHIHVRKVLQHSHGGHH